MPEQRPLVTVAVCTCRRPEWLPLTLRSLAAQTLAPGRFEIVVVDNDPGHSASAVVAEFAARHPHLAVRYETETGPGVSHVRNHALATARGTWLAFIDDDEEASPGWLAELVTAQQAHGADIVLGPVYAIFPPQAPAWLRTIRGNGERNGLATGDIVPYGRGGCGNSLIRIAAVVARQPSAFLPALSRTGGEDADLFDWLRQRGGRIVWCQEAQAGEHVPQERQRLRFHLARNLGFATVYWRSRYVQFGPLRSLVYAAGGAALAAACLVAGFVLFPLLPPRGAPLLMTGMRGVGRVLALTRVEIAGYG